MRVRRRKRRKAEVAGEDRGGRGCSRAKRNGERRTCRKGGGGWGMRVKQRQPVRTSGAARETQEAARGASHRGGHSRPAAGGCAGEEWGAGEAKPGGEGMGLAGRNGAGRPGQSRAQAPVGQPAAQRSPAVYRVNRGLPPLRKLPSVVPSAYPTPNKHATRIPLFRSACSIRDG